MNNPLLAEIMNKNSFRETAPGEHAGPCPKCGGAMRFRISTEKNSFKCNSCKVSGTLAEITSIFPVEFDAEKAFQLLRDLNNTIGAEYPAGALEWLHENRPEVIISLLDMEKQVEAAYLAENMPELKRSVDLLKRSYTKAFKLFTEQPPIIEVQTEMILGAPC
jgi:hypothetical protein